jgi:hypothetical protein
MLITPKQAKNLTYIVIDDLYEPEELLLIKAELQGLLPHLQNREATTSANKTGGGLFLNAYYREDPFKSAILSLNRKLFCNEIVTKATEVNQFFNIIGKCNSDNTLVNYYKSGEEYKPHIDHNPITALTFFSLGEIEGGDFKFPEVNEVVPFKENRMVIFPGCALHAAKPTVAKENAYRVSMAQFLNYVE